VNNVKRFFAVCVAVVGLSACATSGVSVEELRTKANQGDPASQFKLGLAYDSGQGVQRNLTEAAAWYKKAAEQGHAEAQNSLGSMYQNGQGVPQDYAEARRWYQKAADQGNGAAYNNLGFLYDDGLGVKQDKEKAVKFYHTAADAGSLYAVYNLAKSYWRGDGVKQDLIEAYMWMDLARFYTQFHPNRQLKWRIRGELDQIGSQLTKYQIKQAQAMGREWTEAQQKKRQKN